MSNSFIPAAYGATLIEHCLIEVGLSGLVKIDGQFDVTRGKLWYLVHVICLSWDVVKKQGLS